MDGQNRSEIVPLFDQLVFLHGLLDDGCLHFYAHIRQFYTGKIDC